MAPAAQWIGCRNMNLGTGTASAYISCFQFLLAPYPQGGDPLTDGRPDLAAHIISNSWTCPPAEEGCEDIGVLQPAVAVARAAGQFVVAAAGNGSGSCSSITSPIAIYDESFTVGSIDSFGSISDFSLRGPVTVDGSGRLKPDLAAPGEDVLSAVPFYQRPDGYAFFDGTSMATPHVAGAVALLWSGWPWLIGDVAATEELLRAAATPVDDSLCDPGHLPGEPNNVYGAGLLQLGGLPDLIPRFSAWLPLVSTQGA